MPFEEEDVGRWICRGLLFGVAEGSAVSSLLSCCCGFSSGAAQLLALFSNSQAFVAGATTLNSSSCSCVNPPRFGDVRLFRRCNRNGGLLFSTTEMSSSSACVKPDDAQEEKLLCVFALLGLLVPSDADALLPIPVDDCDTPSSSEPLLLQLSICGMPLAIAVKSVRFPVKSVPWKLLSERGGEECFPSTSAIGFWGQGSEVIDGCRFSFLVRASQGEAERLETGMHCLIARSMAATQVATPDA